MSGVVGDECMASAGRLGERESTYRHLGGPHIIIHCCGSISHVRDGVHNTHLYTLLVHPSVDTKTTLWTWGGPC